ncbi:hypothetical protein NUW58_g6795 [Xylaria curta]|uniref:Uncharacterized protein n=1 Tax=Xylaria curta TaxID=42375 RepID=A0ACC1NRN6_9PEZI|nr:hypothetical protein NUW58_g6795 [Xylaria curta]
MDPTNVLFQLLPLNEEAKAVVNLNPDYQLYSGGIKILVFSTQRPSKTAGQLVSIGRHEQNDIRLPTSAPGSHGTRRRTNSGRNYGGYRNHHCFFFLALSGELILRDLTHRLTAIEVPNLLGEEQKKYDLHGTNPRQRVIPRGYADIVITLGTSTHFLFRWGTYFHNKREGEQHHLEQEAHGLARTGMTLSIPHEVQEKQFGKYDLRSRYTPSVSIAPHRYISCHKYEKLGEGGFGVVFKAVDLSSGELWAVKEIKPKAIDDRWKSAFKKEVEMMAPLRHVSDSTLSSNIVHFEHFQGFNIGGTFQLFFQLYKGSLRQLLPEHACIGRLPNLPPWVSRLHSQVLGGLEYLHEEGVIHRDIKPDNVLFDWEESNEGSREPCFYLADFGLSVNSDAFNDSDLAGTLAYMAPETVLERKTLLASDIWSFAIMLGRVLGYWCENERSMTDLEWHKKLVALGDKRPYTPPSTPMPIHRQWYNRILSLVGDGFLPPMFTSMMAQTSFRADAAKCKTAPVEEFTRRPVKPRPIAVQGMWHVSAYSTNDMSIDFPPHKIY